MGILVAYPFLAAIMLTMEYQLCAFNYRTGANGCGAVGPVLNRTAIYPQRTRVFVPWAVGITEWLLGNSEYDKALRLRVYLFWKWVLMSAALMVVAHFFSHVVALGVALYWCLTFQYDYWSVYAECLAFALVLSGNIWLACVGTAIGAMSKSTTAILPLVYLSIGGGWQSLFVGGTFLAVYSAVWLRQRGHDEDKTARINLGVNLVPRWWKRNKCWRGYYILGWATVVAALIVAANYNHLPEPFRSTAWVLPVICVTAIFKAMIREPRVLAITSLWIASLLSCTQ